MQKIETRSILKVGGSYVLPIPMDFAKANGMVNGRRVTIILNDTGMHILGKNGASSSRRQQ